MLGIAVCTVLYESARPFAASYIEALGSAVAAVDGAVQMVFAVDDFTGAERAFMPLRDIGPARFCQTRSGANMAEVRSTLLHAAAGSDVDVLAFTDIDDMLLPDGLRRHVEALQGADFSYGDQIPIDEVGSVIGPPFMAGADVPWRLSDPNELLRRNFVGFSASAVWRRRVPERLLSIPHQVVAADWWFYTMLLHEGRRGARTSGPVVAYRSHQSNLLGPRPRATIEGMERRCDIVRRHYSALPPDPVIATHDDAMVRLLAELRRDGSETATRLRRACDAPGVWYEDIWRMASLMDKQEKEPVARK